MEPKNFGYTWTSRRNFSGFIRWKKIERKTDSSSCLCINARALNNLSCLSVERIMQRGLVKTVEEGVVLVAFLCVMILVI